MHAYAPLHLQEGEVLCTCQVQSQLTRSNWSILNGTCVPVFATCRDKSKMFVIEGANLWNAIKCLPNHGIGKK